MGASPPDVTSRIRTQPELETTPPYLRVEWIAWDSGFRGSGLALGDRIVAVDGVPLEVPADGQERSRWLPGQLGQVSEAQRWRETGAGEGHGVLVTALRQNIGGQGWEEVEAKGTLQPDRYYQTKDERRALAPGGPDWMANDGFNGFWGGWYEDTLVTKVTAALDGGWSFRALTTRYELKSLLDEKPRVDFLLEHYPGPFADTVKTDFDAAVASLAGRRYELTEKDLDYRQADDERARQVAEASKAAWTEFVAGLASETIPAFPAPHPVRDGLAEVAGKVVVLPVLQNKDWVSEAGHGWFVAGSPSDNWYFVDAEAAPAQAMLVAANRYRKVVRPNLGETYALCGRVKGDAMMLMIYEKAYFGGSLDLLGALVGDAMFVDVTKRDGEYAPFAGEDAFTKPRLPAPPDDASPAEVMDAFVTALKFGDLPLWRSLFVSWSVTTRPDGLLHIVPFAVHNPERYWEDARRRMEERVYDIRVVWTGDVRLLAKGDEYPGALRFEEVDVEVDHVGLFEGEYHAFDDPTVTRRWLLQRRNGGPWRIASLQGI